MTPYATHNGQQYRVIYNANGDMWARDVLLNPPMPPRKKKQRQKPVKKASPAQTRQDQTDENIAIALMVYETSVKQTAHHYGVTFRAITCRIRRLEEKIGFRIFPKGGYSLLTYHGKRFIHEQLSKRQEHESAVSKRHAEGIQSAS